MYKICDRWCAPHKCYRCCCCCAHRFRSILVERRTNSSLFLVIILFLRCVALVLWSLLLCRCSWNQPSHKIQDCETAIRTMKMIYINNIWWWLLDKMTANAQRPFSSWTFQAFARINNNNNNNISESIFGPTNTRLTSIRERRTGHILESNIRIREYYLDNIRMQRRNFSNISIISKSTKWKYIVYSFVFAVGTHETTIQKHIRCVPPNKNIFDFRPVRFVPISWFEMPRCAALPNAFILLNMCNMRCSYGFGFILLKYFPTYQAKIGINGAKWKLTHTHTHTCVPIT